MPNEFAAGSHQRSVTRMVAHAAASSSNGLSAEGDETPRIRPEVARKLKFCIIKTNVSNDGDTTAEIGPAAISIFAPQFVQNLAGCVAVDPRLVPHCGQNGIVSVLTCIIYVECKRLYVLCSLPKFFVVLW